MGWMDGVEELGGRREVGGKVVGKLTRWRGESHRGISIGGSALLSKQT
jgi:hypothetical protein